MSSSSSSAGSFVTPQYLTENYGLYRTYGPAFLDQSTRLPDVGWGLEFSVPLLDEPASVAKQVGENQGIANVSPSAEYVTANLVTFAARSTSANSSSTGRVLRQPTRPSTPSCNRNSGPNSTPTPSPRLSQRGHLLRVPRPSPPQPCGVMWPRPRARWPPLPAPSSRQRTFSCIRRPGIGCSRERPQRPAALAAKSHDTATPMAPATDGGPPCGSTGEKLLSLGVWHDGNIAASGSDVQLLICHMPEVFSLVSEDGAARLPGDLRRRAHSRRPVLRLRRAARTALGCCPGPYRQCLHAIPVLR